MKHFNQLTPAEHERLAYLMEECGEVIQIIGKIMRHGYESYDPTDPNNKVVGENGRGIGKTLQVTTNRQLLERELGDVMRAARMLGTSGDVDPLEVDVQASKGPPSKYMHHQGG